MHPQGGASTGPAAQIINFDHGQRLPAVGAMERPVILVFVAVIPGGLGPEAVALAHPGADCIVVSDH